jgi:hypothetical protein
MSATSSTLNARSAERSCASCPLTRSRCSGRGGSTRVASISRSCGGACRSRNSSPWSTVASVMSCRSSRTSTTAPGSSARPLTSRDRKAVSRSGRGAQRRSALSAGTTPDRRSAACTWAQKRAGWLSAGSSDSQATRPGARPAELQEASSVVLPAPAGPDTTVSSSCAPASSSLNSRGRDTRRGGGRGWVSLVTISGVGPSPASCRSAAGVEREAPILRSPRWGQVSGVRAWGWR